VESGHAFRQDRQMAWQRTHLGTEKNDGKVGGLPVWKHEWRRQMGEAWLPEAAPADAQLKFQIYEIGGVGWPVQARFAAAEISNGVWSFWEEV